MAATQNPLREAAHRPKPKLGVTRHALVLNEARQRGMPPAAKTMSALAAAATATSGGFSASRSALKTDFEVDDNIAGVALHIVHFNLRSVTMLNLLQQRQRIVIVHEAHDIAIAKRFQRAEYGGMAETLGNSARIEGENAIFGNCILATRHAQNSIQNGKERTCKTKMD